MSLNLRREIFRSQVEYKYKYIFFIYKAKDLRLEAKLSFAKLQD